MIYFRVINKDTKGHRIYLPPEIIRQLAWFKGDQLAIFVDSQQRIVIDKITIEKYPAFFQCNGEKIISKIPQYGSLEITS